MGAGRGRAGRRPSPGSARPDLILIHPAISEEAARRYCADLWPQGNLWRPPEGYREISFAFFGLRAFVHTGHAAALPTPEVDLPLRVTAWVDQQAQRWNLADVLAVRGLPFWSFLRDRMIDWLVQRMAERRVIEQLAGGEFFGVLGIGLGASRRALLRALGEASDGRLRAEVAVEPPPAEVQETTAERRFRKIFFLVQDFWHGVQYLAEDVFLRRPRVLLTSDSLCWKRTLRAGEGWTRTDVHLEHVWREGRRRPLRLYYRTDRYDPEVGAMTGGRLAPTFLRHFLFLLAQTSRGYWETRGIQRQWRLLRQQAAFREGLAFEGLPVGEMVATWLDAAITERLPHYVRSTRRESHFLRGARPEAILLTHEQGENRALLAAARSLGIPTVGLQLRPFHAWDHGYRLPTHDPERSTCLPDRLCVFSAAAKEFLVEQGGVDPSRVLVTGDPRLPGGARRPAASGGEGQTRAHRIEEIRRRWGVEGSRRVLALSCRPGECPLLLAWLAAAAGDREGLFVLVHPPAEAEEAGVLYRPLAVGQRLPWLHVDAKRTFADWLEAVDLLVTTSWPEAVEAIRYRTPAVLVQHGAQPSLAGPDPGTLLGRVESEEGIRPWVRDLLAGRLARLPADERWEGFVTATYGAEESAAPGRVMQALEDLVRRT